MSVPEPLAPVVDGDDFGLAGHLAAIERMHREALAQLDALVKPWGSLWSNRQDAALPETELLPAQAQPPVPVALADAV
jgi:hypothetical protein